MKKRPIKRKNHIAGSLDTSKRVSQFFGNDDEDIEVKDLSSLYLKPEDKTTFDLIYTKLDNIVKLEELHSYTNRLKDNSYIAVWSIDSRFVLIKTELRLLYQLYLCIDGPVTAKPFGPPKNILTLYVYGHPDNTQYNDIFSSYFISNLSAERNIHGDPLAIPFTVSQTIINALSPKDGSIFDPYPNNGSIARASLLCGRDTRVIKPEDQYLTKFQTTISKTYDRINKSS